VRFAYRRGIREGARASVEILMENRGVVSPEASVKGVLS
jgi:hypothetical protein